jgi:hypothetical protein
MILPLANSRDKHTQVLWGIRDFEFRFGRLPEGMWLPETAADLATLDVLAEHGIKFTILSPYQASRVRSLQKDAEWEDVNGARIDPTMPYVVKLPSGRSIVIFFYDSPVSQAVAFEKLLVNGERFSARLLDAFDDGRQHDQLVHIGTDGESYGHHFQFGDMALAFALHRIEENESTQLSIYAEFLESHPPTHEAEIHEGSAWSCSHGVERWKSDCGCNSGGHGGWNQKWRTPLRQAMDWLRDKLAPFYESKAGEFLKDPWQARDEYIFVILNRSTENIARFFASAAKRTLTESEQAIVFRLLEMQRHAMLMYTSCGWFFDELSGIETVQVIQYAARALQLATELGAENFEPGFLDILAEAKSNIPEHQDGRAIYENFVKPSVMTLEKVAAHYAISSLFESYPEETKIYSYTVKQEDRQMFSAGSIRLAVGRIKVIFAVTGDTATVTYMVLHMGEHNLNCGVRPSKDLESYQQMVGESKTAFDRTDFAEIIRLMDRHFGAVHYTLKNLFRDEQFKALNQILATTREDIYNTYRLLTDRYSPLAHFLNDMRVPPLSSLAPATEFVINAELQKQFQNGHVDPEKVKALLREANTINAVLEKDQIAFAVKKHFDRLSEELQKTPEDVEILQHFTTSAALIPQMPFGINLWKPQNTYDQLRTKVLPEIKERADEKSKMWVEKFTVLGRQLGFHIQPG